jgi:hypothetical protein
VGDAAPRGSEVWAEWWRLHGLEPRTGRHFSIEFQARGVPEFDPGPFTGASGADQLVKRGESTLLDVASLTRAPDGWRMVVSHRLRISSTPVLLVEDVDRRAGGARRSHRRSRAAAVSSTEATRALQTLHVDGANER